jgi:hypothetical protein
VLANQLECYLILTCSVHQPDGVQNSRREKEDSQQHWFVQASTSGGSGDLETPKETVTMLSGVNTREELKKLVMSAVSNTNRGKVAAT